MKTDPKLVLPHFSVASLLVAVILYSNYTLFSSPEHKVLMVSYCDRPLPVVLRRPSCDVRRPSCVNFFT